MPTTKNPPIPNLIVFSKPAIPGQVKTRLTPNLTPDQAAAVHFAMRKCLLNRLSKHAKTEPKSLKIAQNEANQLKTAQNNPKLPPQLTPKFQPPKEFTQIPQGQGDLGERMTRIWQQAPQTPTIFLGTDSPDIPYETLTQITKALTTHDLAIGPVPDGGYYTLAVREYHPILLQNITWGTQHVFSQTKLAAKSQNLSVNVLPSWYDIDDIDDLKLLINRIKPSQDNDLQILHQELIAIVKE